MDSTWCFALQEQSINHRNSLPFHDSNRGSPDVAYKEFYRYKVSHLKYCEAVFKVGHPRGEKKQILSGNDNKKNRGKD